MTQSPHDDSFLLDAGASPENLESLRQYVANSFRLDTVPADSRLPLEDEPHVSDWRRYQTESMDSDVFSYLQTKLPQLNIPIRPGMASTGTYRRVARRGEAFRHDDFGDRLTLEVPGELRLLIQGHPAGALPVLTTSNRKDFLTLLCALGGRSEPRSFPSAVNAQLISGYNNWDRVGRYRDAWQRKRDGSLTHDWAAEMQRVIRTEPSLFQDRIVLVTDAPYSGVTASELELAITDSEWRRRSMSLRLEHEFTHYATKRLWGTMRTNLFDELLADFMGMTHALGRFSKDAFSRFLGLSHWPTAKPNARVHAYQGTLDGQAFVIAGHLILSAAAELERLSDSFYESETRFIFFLALCQLGLVDLVRDGAVPRFLQAYAIARRFCSKEKGLCL